MSHNAIIAEVKKVEQIPGADNIQIGYVIGERVVISKEWGVGKVGVFFKADLQLSEEFCHHNNLLRDSSKNKDNTKAGFFESNRRVMVQPFLKARSEGFFADMSSLSYTGVKLDQLPVGYEFDSLNGFHICRKYISEESKQSVKVAGKPKQAKIDYAPQFLKHVDSEQFKHYVSNIKVGSLLSFHAKVHGTSARYAYTKVVRELPEWKKKVNNVVGFFTHKKFFKEGFKWDYVVGTRNVVLKPQQKDKEGFHGSEAFRYEVMEQIKPFLDKGMTVYGEIAGFANGKPIMSIHNTKSTKDKAFIKKYGDTMTYTYGCKEHEYRFHVYRITYQNEDGLAIDFTDQQVKEWCSSRGFLATLDVHPPMIYDGNQEALEELVEKLTERPECLTEDFVDSSHCSEGIIIRVDDGSLRPKFYKNKSYFFKVMESICEAVDIESAS